MSKLLNGYACFSWKWNIILHVPIPIGFKLTVTKWTVQGFLWQATQRDVELKRKGKHQRVTQCSDKVPSLFAAGRRLLASSGNTNETLISVWGSQIEGWVIRPWSIPSQPHRSSSVREGITLCQSNEPLPPKVDKSENEQHSGGSGVHQVWQACPQQPQSVTRVRTIE